MPFNAAAPKDTTMSDPQLAEAVQACLDAKQHSKPQQ